MAYHIDRPTLGRLLRSNESSRASSESALITNVFNTIQKSIEKQETELTLPEYGPLCGCLPFELHRPQEQR